MNNQMTFLARNAVFAVTNPRKAWATRKAMNKHRKAHPNCEYCGRKPIHVHHIVPVSKAPIFAADPDNFISLCGKRCHITIGHAGNWKHYVFNVVTICDAVTINKREDE